MSFFGLGTSVKSTLIEIVCLCMLSGWVFIEIWIQESWGSKTPSIGLTAALKIGPKLEGYFPKQEGLFA